MVYYNSDGNESTMCGNGGRCITAFAKYLGIIDKEAEFEAIDGFHKSIIENDVVKLQMQDVKSVDSHKGHVFLNTGSPHHVQLEQNLNEMDVKIQGSKIRYSEPYNEAGTLSCGTGVTAVALAMHYTGQTKNNLVTLQTPGGELKVSFEKDKDSYKNVWLIGPATQVFKGEIEC